MKPLSRQFEFRQVFHNEITLLLLTFTNKRSVPFAILAQIFSYEEKYAKLLQVCKNGLHAFSHKLTGFT